ncbi:MAG: hypothetical protein ACKODN_07575 [Actinomycetota bacterium]
MVVPHGNDGQRIGGDGTDSQMENLDAASVIVNENIDSSHHQLEGQAELVSERQLFSLKVENQDEDLGKVQGHCEDRCTAALFFPHHQKDLHNRPQNTRAGGL